MKRNPLSFFKPFSIGLRDGILILLILAVVSPFVYSHVLERTDSSSNVVIGSVAVTDAELPDRPSTPTAEPAQPTAEPTPLPPATPQPTPPQEIPSISTIAGGFIELNLEGIRPGLWTQVQWLAGDGNWYDVNGWGGHVNGESAVLWFVGSNHLGAQPAFRWRVFDGEGGSLLATSENFYLPKSDKETVEVALAMPTK